MTYARGSGHTPRTGPLCNSRQSCLALLLRRFVRVGRVAVIPRGFGFGQIAAAEVGGDALSGAFARIAQAAAAGGPHLHRVAWRQMVALTLREMRRLLDVVAAADLDAVDRAGQTAREAMRARAAMVHHERRLRLAP